MSASLLPLPLRVPKLKFSFSRFLFSFCKYGQVPAAVPPQFNFRCSALEAGRAIHKVAVDAYAELCTVFVKAALDSSLPDWKNEVRNSLSKAMKGHFKPDDYALVWDIFVVCTVIRTARFLVHCVTCLVSLHPELPPTEAAKDGLRGELSSVTEMVLTVRNLLEHGEELGLAAFRTSASYMTRGLELLSAGAASAPGARLRAADEYLGTLVDLPTGNGLFLSMSGAQCAYALASRALDEVEVKLREFLLSKNPQASPSDLKDLPSLCEALKGRVPSAGDLVKSRNGLAHGSLDMGLALKVLEEVDKTMKKIGVSSDFVSAVPSQNLNIPLHVLVERTPGDDFDVKELPQPRVRTAFVGRDEQVLELTDKLAVPGARVGLHGSMGVGKTLLAKSLLLFFEEGAGRVLDAGFIAGVQDRTFGPEVSRFRYFVVLSGSSLAAYQRDWVSFARTLADLHCVPLPNDYEKMSDADLVSKSTPAVARFLADPLKSGHEFLLLVDDLSTEAAECVNASLPSGSRCSIVVTSVSEQVVTSVDPSPTRVATLPLEACMAIVHAVHDDYKRVPGIDQLITNHLECHTLTVCVLAGLLRARPNGTTCVDHFLAIANAFVNSDPSTTAQMTGPIDAHARGLGGFVSLALERLVEGTSEEKVKELLGRLVIVGARGVRVPTALLEVDSADGLLTTSADLGLVEFDALDNSLVTMHRLVIGVLERKWAGTGLLEGTELWKRLAAALADELSNERRRTDRTVDEKLQRLLSTVDNVVGSTYYDGVIVEDVVKVAVGEVFRLAGELAMEGSRLGAASRYIVEAQRLFSVGGAGGDSNTLERAKLLETVGRLDEELGKYEEALEHHRRSLAIKVAVYGSENHADVAASLNNIGVTLESLGRYDEALEHHRRSLEISMAVYGSENHAYVATSLNNIGHTLQSLGRYQEALEHYRRSLAIELAVYGLENHASVAASLNNIGNILESLGRYEEALEHQRRSLEISVAVYGSENHASVATSLGNIGLSLQSLGRYEEALEHQRRSLAIKVAVYGSENHASVAGSLNNIGSTLESLGRYEEALEHQQRSLAIMVAVYGSENHADVATSLNNIGQTLQRLGRYKEALEHNRRSLAIYEAVYGSENHVGVAASLGFIGISLKSLKQYDEALEYQLRSLKIMVAVYGSENHASVAASLHNIGISLKSLKQYDEALKYQRRSLAMYEAVYGPENHASVAASLHNIGSTLESLERYDEALEHYRRVLTIRKTVYGSENHSDVAGSLNNIGSTLGSLGRYEEALEHHRRAWAILVVVHRSGTHADVADSLAAIGLALAGLGRNEEALIKVRSALEIFNEISGRGSHPDLLKLAEVLEQTVQKKKSHRKTR